MLVSGYYGVGKTFAMAALLRHLTLDEEIPCRIIHWKPFLAQIRATFRNDSPMPEVVREVHETTVVVLDDVGPASRTDWDRQILDEIISARYNAMLPTFITTNMSFNKSRGDNSLREWAWQHTISRLGEMCQWISVEGPDRRASKSKQWS